MKVLIDRNIEINAVTHKTALARRLIRWGPHDHIIELAKRAHFPPRDDERFRRAQLPWLATVCNLAKQGKLEFFTSNEIGMERVRQKGHGEGYLGINLLRDIPVKPIRCPEQRPILFAWAGSIGVTEEAQMEFFRSIKHPRFLQITGVTANIDDAFHLWAAEEAGLDVFLTMDQKFWRVVSQKNKIIKSAVRVMTPKELGEHFDAQPSDLERLAAEINPFS